MDRTISRDISKPWPVVDGPCAGESIASVNDDFEVLISTGNQRMLVNDPLISGKRVRYYLRFPESGSPYWSIESC